MIVLGVDPGTARTGYGVVASGEGRLSLLECGVVRTRPPRPLADRIRHIFEAMQSIVQRFEPHVLSVEKVFQGKNPQSALTLGHARGAVLLAGALAGIQIAEYSPTAIKSAVAGTGRATKEQVGFMVKTHLRLVSAPSPDDAADGVAAALCHCLIGNRPR
ncbi:MAG: crossover junction endodeoxyribonuclease RuvC [Gammaproteobacteria bacterium]|nr:crossover junction endodeoxyribonuclease RuvC [Gammaproteobacteria bacterium]